MCLLKSVEWTVAIDIHDVTRKKKKKQITQFVPYRQSTAQITRFAQCEIDPIVCRFAICLSRLF